MFRSNRMYLVVALLSGASLSFAGCSSNDAQSDSGVVLPEKNITEWTMPSDYYNPPDIKLEYYALDLTMQGCLEEAGVPFRVRTFDVDAPHPETETATMHRLFSVEIAQKYGYQQAPDPRINLEDNKALDEISKVWTDQQYDDYARCSDEAAKSLGMVSEPYHFGFNTVEDPMSDPKVVEALKKWRECIAPLGIADLPADATPSDMPTPGLIEQWAWPQDTPPWEKPPASAAEIEVAVADAKCQESSGWNQAVYDAAWDAELAFLKDNFVEINARGERYRALTEKYLEVIKNNG